MLNKKTKAILQYLGIFHQFQSLYYTYLRFPIWKIRLLTSKPENIDSSEKVTVILLSYNRPANMKWIVRPILRCGFVEKVLISNNNPEVTLNDFLDISDQRIEIIDRRTRHYSDVRIHIAEHLGAEYYISIDDDIFLLPHQIKKLFQELIKNPAVPHGVVGSTLNKPCIGIPEGKKLKYFNYHSGHEMPVLTLHAVYAFTKAHVRRYFEILDLLSRTHKEYADADGLKYGEDILLSLTGNCNAIIHHVGHFFGCLTSNQRSVALNSEIGFLDFRFMFYRALYHLNEERSLGMQFGKSFDEILGKNS